MSVYIYTIPFGLDSISLGLRTPLSHQHITCIKRAVAFQGGRGTLDDVQSRQQFLTVSIRAGLMHP